MGKLRRSGGAAGVELGKEMERNREIVEARIVKGFTEEELEQFYSYIERIKKNVSEG